MKTKDKLIIGFIILLIFGYFLYKIKYILTPFIIAIIISYLLNPAVLKFQKYLKISRINSVILLNVVFLSIIAIFSIFLFPILFNQAVNLIISAPQFIDFFSNIFYPKIVNFFASYGIEIEHNFIDFIKNNSSILYDPDFISKIFNNLITSTTFIINILSIIFICPILIFYLLKDWQIIINKIIKNLPQKYFKEIIELSRLINKSVIDFIRGQSYVCLILALFYSITLAVLGLNSAILIGFLTGILSFVPYLGYGTGLVIALITGLIQWGLELYHMGFLIAIYLIGQILESNLLVPNLIGKQIDVHPLWIIFGIFFFGAIFGFIGVLFSLPLTAITAVILKYFFKNYQNTNSK
jgi:predicted PurR-regulated permease PerM